MPGPRYSSRTPRACGISPRCWLPRDATSPRPVCSTPGTRTAGRQGAGSAPTRCSTPRPGSATGLRLAQLDETLADADRDNLPARSAAAQAERDVLIRELKAAVGLGGRARRLGDDAERARKAVTARIRDSIARIDARHPVLGTHLRESITTGLFCRYAPAEPPLWRT